ncbi:MAG: hypothetical protein GY708_30790 [Actinomycetia bacterium]|nr:hypothetical protein [Actinomycetes bacterium]
MTDRSRKGLVSLPTRPLVVLGTAIVLGTLLAACAPNTIPVDPGAAAATVEGPDANGGYTFTIQIPGGAEKGFAVATDADGTLIEIGPRVVIDRSGRGTVYYVPSSSRPDLAGKVRSIAFYIGDQRLYVDLP